MDKDQFLYDVKIEGITKYELVLLAARRAREINEMRINLEKKHETRLIEKEKPTIVAMKEILAGKIGYEFHDPDEQTEEAPQRGMKKTV
ncbi:DNA-directed RNA polymerase subunit omega [bacterium]|nr:DNA-directed RNA polymerase subunit omega [bacterium]